MLSWLFHHDCGSKTFKKNKLDSKFEISKHGLSNLPTGKKQARFSKQIHQLGLCLHSSGYTILYPSTLKTVLHNYYYV